ncbi:MAG: hypothetical protein KBC33_00885 [Candidatus Pacebacteria bacterium]|nr:hypothetical protein [Candidatus Paceibacterota bacterium]
MRIYISAFIVLALVLGAHISGLDGYYYTIDGYDVFMHIAGGVGIGLFVAALLRSYRQGALFSRRNVILGVIVIGIVWELFEIVYKLTGHPLWTKLYYIDTVKDMVDDVLGGAVVAWILGRKAKIEISK